MSLMLNSFVAKLLANAPLSAVVGTRIATSELARNAPLPAVVVLSMPASRRHSMQNTGSAGGYDGSTRGIEIEMMARVGCLRLKTDGMEAVKALERLVITAADAQSSTATGFDSVRFECKIEGETRVGDAGDAFLVESVWRISGVRT